MSRSTYALRFTLYVLIFVGATVLYATTLNPDVQPADSGELQLAAITLGIPHPPGYPLFTVLGWLFAQVPIGSPFARVTFLSVVASAGTLVLVAACVMMREGDEEMRRLKTSLPSSPHPLIPSSFAALLAALTLGTSTTFWAQATTTNIRSLTAFFTALMVFALVRFKLTAHRSWLMAFALALGLGVGHHVSLVFIGAVFGVFVLGMGIRARLPLRDFVVAGLVLLATQLVWLYLPLRNSAASKLDHGNLATLQGFLDHVLARGFEGDLFYFIRTEPALFWDRLALTPTLLQFQFSLPVLTLMALAAVITLWRERTLGIILLAAFALHGFITLTYRAPQTVEYALPCWVLACVILGIGISRVGQWFLAFLSNDSITSPLVIQRSAIMTGRSLPTGVVVVMMVACIGLPILDGLGKHSSFVQLGQDRSTRTHAEAVLRYTNQNETVFSQWHQATPLWALQEVERLRPDVRVNYVYPQGAEPYETTFAKRAAASAKQGNTYVTSFYEAEFGQANLQALPLSNTPAWRVAPEIGIASATFSRTVWDDRIILVHPLGLPKQVEVGAQFTIDLWWSSRGAHSEGDSITVRILRRDGRLATNADVRLTGSEGGGVVQFKRAVLAAPLDLEPGEYDILAGAYNGSVIYKTKDSEAFVKVGRISVISSPLELPAIGDSTLWIPFANQIMLIGKTLVRSGSTLKIELQWAALQPLTEDYKISVRLRAKNFYKAHDGVPALGAIPTLKWIRGSQITDRHVFNLTDYDPALHGPLEAEVVVYDNTTRIPLIALDERYANGVTIAIP